MNHLPHGEHISECTVPNLCHPERNLAESEANGQTQSKDLCQLDRTLGVRENFRIAIHFYDDHGDEIHHVQSREAAECESPARKCRVSERKGIESRRDVTRAQTTQ